MRNVSYSIHNLDCFLLRGHRLFPQHKRRRLLHKNLKYRRFHLANNTSVISQFRRGCQSCSMHVGQRPPIGSTRLNLEGIAQKETDLSQRPVTVSASTNACTSKFNMAPHNLLVTNSEAAYNQPLQYRGILRYCHGTCDSPRSNVRTFRAREEFGSQRSANK